MNILAPWSLSSYIDLGGFRPLYQPLAANGARGCRVFTPKTPGFEELRKLADQNFYDIGPFSLNAPSWAGTATELFDEFSGVYGARDLWLQSHLPGDVELHHTAPVTCGDRPFVLHCESFLPVFYPFFRQEADFDPGRVAAIRGFYRNLFESENCLGIFSHIDETLEQFSSFFQSDVVDRKLVGMPIGLDKSHIVRNVEKSSDAIKFVFLNAAYHNADAFALQGGISCLKLALALLRARTDLVFYFRTARPGDDMLSSYGFDIDELTRHEATRIVWVENYLSSELCDTLVAKCHFLLLPGADLHSVPIMSALANGTVPIVTDTIGTDLYVEDMVNGVVIPGVRAEVSVKDETLRMARSRPDRFRDIERSVTASLIGKVRELLYRPGKIREMADAGRRAISQRFDGATFADRLVEEMRTRSAGSLDNRAGRQKPRIADNERWIEDILPEHFSGPSQPLERIRSDSGVVAQLGREFFFIPNESRAAAGNNDFWSPVPWWAIGRFGGAGPTAFRGQSAGECMAFATGHHHAPSISLAQRAYVALRPYPVRFAIARTGYRLARRIGLMR